MDKIIKLVILTLLLVSYNSLTYSQIRQPVTKSYKFKYRDSEDFILLVKALLSKKGTIQESKEMNMIIVKDYPANIEKVDSLISKNDRPLKQVVITIQLYLCSKVNDNPVEPRFSEIKKLTDGFYDFNTFERIDRCLITTKENSFTEFSFAGDAYSVSFTLDYIEEIEKIVKFRNFTLNEIDRTIRGSVRKKILETSSKILDGTITILSASKYKDTNKTLVVIVGANIT